MADGKKNINQVTNATALSNSDYVFISKSGENLQKIKYDTLINQMYTTGDFMSNTSGIAAGTHNSIYRGKNLGTSFTDAQSTEIKNGTFKDIFVGDYWTINGRIYRVAGCDIIYRCGDNISLGHHVIVVPDNALYNGQMHNTTTGSYLDDATNNTTEGGYFSADMRNLNLSNARATITSDFGVSHVLSYRDLLTTSIGVYADIVDKSNNWEWKDCTIELMSEIMVYGLTFWGTSPYEGGIFKSQFPLFKLNPSMIGTRYNYWLRSIASASSFCCVSSQGIANSSEASRVFGVRPFAIIA